MDKRVEHIVWMYLRNGQTHTYHFDNRDIADAFLSLVGNAKEVRNGMVTCAYVDERYVYYGNG